MKSFALDESGDLIFENGKIKMVVQKENLVQRIKNSIASYQGDWFLSPQIGIDWFSLLGKKFVSEREIRIAIEDVVKKDKDVKNIENLEIKFDNQERHVMIKINLTTNFGDVEIKL